MNSFMCHVSIFSFESQHHILFIYIFSTRKTMFPHKQLRYVFSPFSLLHKHTCPTHPSLLIDHNLLIHLPSRVCVNPNSNMKSNCTFIFFVFVCLIQSKRWMEWGMVNGDLISLSYFCVKLMSISIYGVCDLWFPWDSIFNGYRFPSFCFWFSTCRLGWW